MALNLKKKKKKIVYFNYTLLRQNKNHKVFAIIKHILKIKHKIQNINNHIPIRIKWLCDHTLAMTKILSSRYVSDRTFVQPVL